MGPTQSPIPFVFPILTSLLAAHRHGARQRQPARARVAAWRPTINRADLLSGRPASSLCSAGPACLLPVRDAADAFFYAGRTVMRHRYNLHSAGVVAHGWLRCRASELVAFSGARQAI